MVVSLCLHRAKLKTPLIIQYLKEQFTHKCLGIKAEYPLVTHNKEPFLI